MVTKQEAEKVFSDLKTKYKNYPEFKEAKLVKDWQYMGWRNGKAEYYEPVPYAIIWEAGPDEWAYRASTEVPGVDVEAFTSWTLAIYED